MQSRKLLVRQKRGVSHANYFTQSTASLENSHQALDLAFQAFQLASCNFTGSISQAAAIADAYKKIYLALVQQGKSREALNYLRRGVSFVESNPVQTDLRQELRDLWKCQSKRSLSSSKPRLTEPLPQLRTGFLLQTKKKQSSDKSILAVLDRVIPQGRNPSRVFNPRTAKSVVNNARSFQSNLESAKKLYRELRSRVRNEGLVKQQVAVPLLQLILRTWAAKRKVHEKKQQVLMIQTCLRRLLAKDCLQEAICVARRTQQQSQPAQAVELTELETRKKCVVF